MKKFPWLTTGLYTALAGLLGLAAFSYSEPVGHVRGDSKPNVPHGGHPAPISRQAPHPIAPARQVWAQDWAQVASLAMKTKGPQRITKPLQATFPHSQGARPAREGVRQRGNGATPLALTFHLTELDALLRFSAEQAQ